MVLILFSLISLEIIQNIDQTSKALESNDVIKCFRILYMFTSLILLKSLKQLLNIK